MKHSLLFSLLLISACSVENTKRELLDEKVLDNIELFASVSTMESQAQFNVTPQMVAKYLRLFSSEKTVKSIEPIMKSQDTLAYYVLYDNNCGWDLISGDMRTAPILASSQSGILDLNENDNSSIAFINNLSTIIENERVNNNLCDGVWRAIFKKSRSERFKTKSFNKTHKNLGDNRGLGEGMWIAIDTTYRYITTSPFQSNSRLITTTWWQRTPWNTCTPQCNNNHSLVGCGPVAVGQIIYKYVDTTLATGTHPVPTNVYWVGNNIYFTDSTIQGWSELAINTNNWNSPAINRTAIYLSWLGDKMNADYSDTVTHTTILNQKRVLDYYVTYSGKILEPHESIPPQTFCNTVLSSLDEGSPVLIAAETFYGKSHAFIIDYYEVYAYQEVIRYQFDPDHSITEEELLFNPQWMFEWPVNYSHDTPEPEIEMASDISNSVYIRFKWGYDPNSYYGANRDNVNHLLRHRSYYEHMMIYEYYAPFSFNVEMESGAIYTYNKLLYWFHHFNRKNN